MSLFVISSCVQLPSQEKNTQSPSQKKIGIIPIEFAETNSLDKVQKKLSEIYEMSVVILVSQKMPQEAFINIKSPRYRADKLIAHLKKNKADSIDYYLGITSKDISISKKDKLRRVKRPKSKYEDWGIFGLGYRPGPSCIVSTYRLKNNASKTQDRLTKACVHEVGHNLGLRHCPDKKCVMTDACESIKTVDNVKLALCANCKAQIDS